MNMSPLRSIAIALVVLAIGQGAAHAQEPGWRTAFTRPLDFDRLDAMRGGYGLPSGLKISFGFERVVYINGVLATTTAVHIADIGTMTADQARALAEARRGVLVQVGSGNAWMGGVPSNGLIIQNTFNDQDIRVLTTLDIGVNTLGLFKALNAQAALHTALIAAANSP